MSYTNRWGAAREANQYDVSDHLATRIEIADRPSGRLYLGTDALRPGSVESNSKTHKRVDGISQNAMDAVKRTQADAVAAQGGILSENAYEAEELWRKLRDTLFPKKLQGLTVDLLKVGKNLFTELTGPISSVFAWISDVCSLKIATHDVNGKAITPHQGFVDAFEDRSSRLTEMLGQDPEALKVVIGGVLKLADQVTGRKAEKEGLPALEGVMDGLYQKGEYSSFDRLVLARHFAELVAARLDHLAQLTEPGKESEISQKKHPITIEKIKDENTGVTHTHVFIHNITLGKAGENPQFFEKFELDAQGMSLIAMDSLPRLGLKEQKEIDAQDHAHMQKHGGLNTRAERATKMILGMLKEVNMTPEELAEILGPRHQKLSEEQARAEVVLAKLSLASESPERDVMVAILNDCVTRTEEGKIRYDDVKLRENMYKLQDEPRPSLKQTDANLFTRLDAMGILYEAKHDLGIYYGQNGSGARPRPTPQRAETRPEMARA